MQCLQVLNVFQSFQLPFALLPVVHANIRADIMASFAMRSAFRWVLQILVGGLLLLNMATAVNFARGGTTTSLATGFATVVGLSAYFLFVLYLMVGPLVLHKLLVRMHSARATKWLGWLTQAPKPGSTGEAVDQEDSSVPPEGAAACAQL